MWNEAINYDIEGKDGTRLTCVNLASIEKMVDRLHKDFEGRDSKEVLLPFEFIIGSLFPESYSKLKEVMTLQYIEGYNAGLASREESK